MEENIFEGNEQVDNTPAAPKSNVWKIVLITVFCCLLLTVMVAVVLIGSGVVTFESGKQNPETTEPPTTVNNAVLNSYTVDAATAAAKANEVVATVGDRELTNGELQVYYWLSIYDFIDSNSYWLPYMGVDFSLPLDQQIYDQATGQTWQEAMLDYALTTWHQYTAINLYAAQQGYTLDEDGEKYLQELELNIAAMLNSYGFSSLEDMLASEMGPGATPDGYHNYMKDGYCAIEYVTDFEESIKPTLEELETYFTEHETEYTSGGVTKEAGDAVSVRHVLIMPEGGTTDENNKTTYSEEEWETARVKAQQLLDDYLAANGDEIAFSELAKKHSVDGSASNGGLYTGVLQGDMVEEFDAWIFDESRQYGDTGLVKTVYGYHLMFFVEREPQWISAVESDMKADAINEMVEKAQQTWPITKNDDKIVLGEFVIQ